MGQVMKPWQRGVRRLAHRIAGPYRLINPQRDSRRRVDIHDARDFVIVRECMYGERTTQRVMYSQNKKTFGEMLIYLRAAYVLEKRERPDWTHTDKETCHDVYQLHYRSPGGQYTRRLEKVAEELRNA